MASDDDNIERRSPHSLSPHPQNEEIYGDRDLDNEEDTPFLESIRENGVLTPVIVDEADQIISGHRRIEAAKQVGLETVPITAREFDSDLERTELLVHSNRQRSKTVSQKLREAEALERVERERARERQGARTDTSCSDEREVDDGLTRDRVAEKVGFGSGSTYHRAKTVWEARESDEETVAVVAEEQLGQLDEEKQSISAAYSEVKNAQNRVNESSNEDESEQASNDPTGSSDPRITLLQGDAGSLPLDDETVDVIITSPPYNLGHERWAMGWRSLREEGVGYYDDRPEDEYQDWQQQVLSECYRVAREGASLFYVHKVRIDGGEVIHPVEWLRSPANPWSVRQEIVWNRKSTHNHEPTLFRPQDARIYWLTKGTPAVPDEGIDMDSVWDIYGPRPDTDHPAPFPEEIPQGCLEAVASDGDVVLDPMGGSMTTCRVASDLGYQSIGVDANRDYIEDAQQKQSDGST
ncbi:DNA methyltransferase [Halorubellus sp. PRR65]|uniref:DNA methyltransferase n=1 Tax=Halorubellus sp. PRR65 TaxID=3098148 RepID=UPI002B25912D|nr:DNA methyltransferase [Halorubellus sp. PRR65]